MRDQSWRRTFFGEKLVQRRRVEKPKDFAGSVTHTTGLQTRPRHLHARPSGDVIAFNDDWQQSDEASIQNMGLAPQFSEESAILTTLGPGAFTAILRGLDDSSGVGLFEVYNLR